MFEGMGVLDANVGRSRHGVFTNRAGALTNDFFVNLLDMDTDCMPVDEREELFEGGDRKTGMFRWTATRVDLIFGSNSELCAISKVYGATDAQDKFVEDFIFG